MKKKIYHTVGTVDNSNLSIFFIIDILYQTTYEKVRSVYIDNCSTWLFQIKHIIYNVYPLLLSLIERLLEILKLRLRNNSIVFEEFPVS